MRASNCSDAIECIAHVGDPVAQSIVHRIFQGAPTRGDGDDLGAQQAHTEDVGCLAFNVMCAHIDNALQAELGADGGRGHAVLARAGFGDDALFAHAPRKNDLAQHVVDLMRAGVVQLVAFHIHLGTAQMFGQPFGKIERAWPANVIGPQIIHLGPETVVSLGLFILGFQLQNKRHQRFRNKTPPKITKAAIFVGSAHERVEKIMVHEVLLALNAQP